jgi:methylmalonyl-CoA mutase
MNPEANQNSLFNQFPAVSAAQWAEKIKKDLKGIDPETLVWQTYEGLEIKPFYTAEDIPAPHLQHNLPGKFPYSRGHKSGKNSWHNLQEITVVPENSLQAIDKATQALASGANGIHFIIPHPETFDFNYLITTLNLPQTVICFTVENKPDVFIADFFRHLKEQGISPHSLKGFINLSQPLLPDNFPTEYDHLEALLDLTKESVDFYGITVNGAAFGNRGATVVQELAFILGAAVDYIDILSNRGLLLPTIFRNIQVIASVGTNYFFEIAKMRALRLLWAGLVKAYQEEPTAAAFLRIHAQTSRWLATTFDPHINILRSTTESMAAILGGCDSLAVAPFDITFNEGNSFAERISRNIPLILQHESYLDQTLDPAAGSYYLETLTQELAEKAWSLFKEVESRGGYAKALQSGFIMENINQAAEEKFKNIASGEEVLVGTNKFANKHEKIDFDPETLLQGNYFDTTRASYPFEVMRLAALLHYRKKSARAKAIISIIGHDIQEHIHAAFAKEFFECGDFETEIIHFDSVKAALEKLLFTDCKVLVFSSTETDYLRFSQQYLEALKNHRQRPVLILAAPPQTMKEELEENGFDARIFQNCNTRSIIGRIQERLMTNEL